MLQTITRSHHWKLASLIFAVLFFLTLLLAEDGDLRDRLEGFTQSAKQGLEAVQIPENFLDCLLMGNPELARPDDALARSLCGHGALAARIVPHVIVRIVVGTPGALAYALAAGFASGAVGAVMSALMVVWFLALIASWLGEREKNPLELVVGVALSFLALWLVRLLIVGVLAGFGWLVQLIGFCAAILLGLAKALDLLELMHKAREIVSER